MSIKVRLFITYIIGLILPFMLFLGLGKLEPQFLQKMEPVDGPFWVVHSIPKASPGTDTELSAIARQLEADIKRDPSLILNTDYRRSLKQKLAPYNAYVAYNEDTGTLLYSGDTPFWVLNEAESYGDYQRFFIQHAVVLGILYVIIYTLLAILMARSINRKLKPVLAATEEIGRLNFGYRIGNTENGEFGELCRTFDRMAEQADASIQMMRKYEEDRRELISNISHDLRTPLTAIKGSIDAISDGIADTPEKREQYWQIIRNRIDLMRDLIDELFLYSKLDTRQEQFQFQQVRLERFVEDVAEEWRLENGGMDIRVSYVTDRDDGYPVYLDLDKMNRVLLNILGNSVKYAVVSPLLIRISLSRRESFAVLNISDNGVGVPAGEAGRLFDRFYRGDTSRDSSVPGSGLGLAIARQIVEAHGGRIWAESDTNRGMNMFIELELKEERHETDSDR